MIRPTYSKVYKSEEVTEFRIKDNDIIYFDPKFLAFKIHFEQYFEKRLKGSNPQVAFPNRMQEYVSVLAAQTAHLPIREGTVDAV